LDVNLDFDPAKKCSASKLAFDRRRLLFGPEAIAWNNRRDRHQRRKKAVIRSSRLNDTSAHRSDASLRLF
jgi:hypothetical protein